jgi:hypothetical protein
MVTMWWRHERAGEHHQEAHMVAPRRDERANAYPRKCGSAQECVWQVCTRVARVAYMDLVK